MSVQGARTVAYEVLRAVSGDEAYANLLLPHAIVRARLDAKDAGLATELTYGTLRRRGTYDAIIAAAADRTVDRIDPNVLDALRLGVHQLLSTRVASHAAVNESVELARRHGGGKGAAGFANAVLRRVSRDTPGQWMDRIAAAARSDDERIGLTTSHPVWIVRALRRALTAEGRADELTALLESDNIAPRVAMIALPGLAEVPEDAASTRFAPTAFTTRGGDPEGLIRASGGRLRVQDEGSQLAALALSRALPVRAGERWLDLCAGPGGKTALLAAEALAHGATLDANEIAPARAGLVRQAVASVPLEVEVSEEDGRERAARMPGQYDRILVDAPCTGIGALRRRPEARWRKTPADVPDLTALQQDLVLAAFEALTPGGVVAYVTCSPHLAETSGVLAEVKRELGDEVEELDARAVVRSVAVDEIDLPDQADGSLRAQLWPHRHGTDAMSIALLRKR
ncbi:16S rRNA (cytosine967-C5)-methyltransferase [Microbacterium proteolyticum]|uniref:16S rRNA (Cytosine967-C5)-methyltransferase n=1 Tax=Microbacterium proteolyticum TaxID=1572644 RepID=A0A7W5CI66_9MICO|nr:transcription antitermination factor NusB [Microbacterium proteolyticum]MBB3158131.1 16S rRNA (cytosine967-C5)-methyltransferase [Microbacterium proteolyticum]